MGPKIQQLGLAESFSKAKERSLKMQRASSLVLVHIFSYRQALWLLTGVILSGEVRYWPHAAQHSAH